MATPQATDNSTAYRKTVPGGAKKWAEINGWSGNTVVDAGSLKSASVSRIVSKDSNNEELQALTVPAAIQALPGYGWSAGTARNAVDWTRGKYIQRVASLDIGSVEWSRTPVTVGGVTWYLFFRTVAGKSLSFGNIACAKYTTVPGNYTDITGDKMASSYYYNSDSRIGIRDDTYTDAATFKAAMSGVYIYYELATPVETDISNLLPESNLMVVEPGGSLTFENTNGSSYQLPVPSEVGYYDARRASRFGSVWSYPSLDIIQQKVDVAPAAPKTNYADVPGANGSKDLTEALGVGVTYNDRELVWTFALYPGADWRSKQAQVSNAINGIACHIVLDDDPQWFYDGRLIVSEHESDKLLRQITVKSICRPYKRKLAESSVSRSDLDTSYKELICEIGSMPLVPTITVSHQTMIKWGDAVVTVNAGTHTIPDLRMSGRQVLQVKRTSGSAGTITITWREGSL